jgi:oligoendopeptidase F
VEKFLQDSTQVIVDILSRYRFESALFERRAEGELSPQELKELMLNAQKETYGDALQESELHPYMWAVKPHYYRPELSFYNFPYAFGKLFGLALYQRYLKEGEAFRETYRTLLQETGRASAVEVTRKAGFDIESAGFWRGGLEMIEQRVRQFLHLVGKHTDKVGEESGA